MRNGDYRLVPARVCIIIGMTVLLCLPAMQSSASAVAEKIEQAITSASEHYDSGEIREGAPYRVEINDDITLIFSYEQFDADLSRAFDLYSAALEGTIETSAKPKAAAQPEMKAKTEVAVKAEPTVHTAPPPPAPKKKQPAADDPIGALMQAEKATNRAAGVSSIPPMQFDVYEQFHSSHATRVQQQDMAAEADMAMLVGQRQAAEEQRLQRLQQQQELQSQAMQWQAQLDKQASEAARKAAEWEAQHSFGAYATSFLATVAQTAIGSFTGGLLNPIATELANKAVDKWFNIDPGTVDQYQINDD
jgi:hypothetical protein